MEHFALNYLAQWRERPFTGENGSIPLVICILSSVGRASDF